MASLPVMAIGFFLKLVAGIFVFSAAVLMLVILIQKGKGGGLSAAFGGGGTSGLLGSKTGDFLTWVTIVLAGMFLLLGLVMAKYYKPSIGSYTAEPVQPPAASNPVQQNRTGQGETTPAPVMPANPAAGRVDVNLPGK